MIATDNIFKQLAILLFQRVAASHKLGIFIPSAKLRQNLSAALVLALPVIEYVQGIGSTVADNGKKTRIQQLDGVVKKTKNRFLQY